MVTVFFAFVTVAFFAALAASVIDTVARTSPGA